MAKGKVGKRYAPCGKVGGTYFKAWRHYRQKSGGWVAARIEQFIEDGEVDENTGSTKTRVSLKENGEEPWDSSYLRALSLALNVSEIALLSVNPFNKSVSPAHVMLEEMQPHVRERAEDAVRAYYKAEVENQGD